MPSSTEGNDQGLSINVSNLYRSNNKQTWWLQKLCTFTNLSTTSTLRANFVMVRLVCFRIPIIDIIVEAKSGYVNFGSGLFILSIFNILKKATGKIYFHFCFESSSSSINTDDGCSRQLKYLLINVSSFWYSKIVLRFFKNYEMIL